MIRRVRTTVLLLAAVLSPGCDDGRPWGTGESSSGVEAREDFGPTAAYARRLIFIGPGTQLPTAAIFDFTSLSDSVGVRRGVRVRILTDRAWEALMDAGWELEPLRDPWRIVPGDELKIVVNDAGELAAVVFRGEPEVRLEPGTLLAESSPDGGTQFVLRQATLSVAGELVRGVLLDSQLGRAVHPTAVPRPLADDTTAADGGGPGRNGRATPIARAGAEAFLVNDGGYYAVFATSADGETGWVSDAGTDQLHPGASLEPVPGPAVDGPGIQMPGTWRIHGAGSGLAGELTAAATDPSPLSDMGELTALGYILVSGWVEDGGVRRDVFGLVRHVR